MKYLALVACLFFLTCGKSEHAGTGGSTETTNGFSAMIQDSLGQPSVGTKVMLLKTSWPQVSMQSQNLVLDSGITDSNGFWEGFAQADSAWIWAEDSLGSMALRSLLKVDQQQKKLALRSKRPVLIQQASTITVSSVVLEGVPYALALDSILFLPPGKYSSLGVSQATDSSAGQWYMLQALHIPENHSQDTTTILEWVIEAQSHIILEDFANLSLVSKLYPYTQYGYWWMNWSGAQQNDSSVATPNESWLGVGMHADANGAERACYGFAFTQDSSVVGSWISFGMDMGAVVEKQGVIPVNMESLDSIVITAFGSGSWNVQLVPANGSLPGEQWSYTWQPDSVWHSVAVSPSEFTWIGSSQPPTAFPTRVQGLVFQSATTGALYIDSVVLYGMNIQNWFGE
jgi:hypothetical protein